MMWFVNNECFARMFWSFNIEMADEKMPLTLEWVFESSNSLDAGCGDRGNVKFGDQVLSESCLFLVSVWVNFVFCFYLECSTTNRSTHLRQPPTTRNAYIPNMPGCSRWKWNFRLNCQKNSILKRILLPLNAAHRIFKYKKTASWIWELKTQTHIQLNFKFGIDSITKFLVKRKMDVLKVLTVFLVVLFGFAAGKSRLFLFIQQFHSIVRRTNIQIWTIFSTAQRSCGEGTESQLQENCNNFCRKNFGMGQCFKSEYNGLLHTVCLCRYKPL